MSKFKAAKASKKVAKNVEVEEEEMETSDDDYIDPKMEKYFSQKKRRKTV